MRKLKMADAAFLMVEKRQTPMHVGGLSVFTLPEGVDEPQFLAKLAQLLRSTDEYRRPFGEHIDINKLGVYRWKEDSNLDVDYHVRHSALPQPGSDRELFQLVSRLHTQLMDRTRPLWETHLIEGLQDRKFALYMKMHHAAIDGVGAMHLTNSMFSTRKNTRSKFSPFSQDAYEAYLATKSVGNYPEITPRKRELKNVLEALKQTFDSGVSLATATSRFSRAFLGMNNKLAVPWRSTPQTSLNSKTGGSRRIVAHSWKIDRIKTVSAALNGTVNDVVLAMCAGALRRYLISTSELPAQSLKAMTPISLREEGDFETANSVGFITADLATNIIDPEDRFRKIKTSMRSGKELLQLLSPRERMLFNQITQVPLILSFILGLADRFPPFNTVISNVRGPEKQLYWNGARLDGIYPASAIFDGFSMNITLVGYKGQLDFGIVACRRSMPNIQGIIGHLEESLAELESVAEINKVV